ncbi:MAG: NAD(P)/FAD-dependent oxidoreductase [Acidothermus sp.]|nr:NAD(P)/FAD-dependent oxidoreductase [Acidothermus sp.]
MDVAVVGAGHNGLVAATLLARAGLRVTVFERSAVVGGAARTERPFHRASGLGQSTGAYLLGLMPPELLRLLEVDLPLLRRDPHYFLPRSDGRYLLLGSDRQAAAANFRAFFSDADARADGALQAELAALREDFAPAWLAEPLSVEETAERYIRPALRSVFINLCRGSVLDYLDRFGFRSEVVTAMYAVTDGISGLSRCFDEPGSGHNFLVHNMTRLPGSAGTWMLVRGGMGTVSKRLADAARRAGAQIRCGTTVTRIEVGPDGVRSIVLDDAESVDVRLVVAATDPFVVRDLVGAARLPDSLAARYARWSCPGMTSKVNLALRDLPRFPCLPNPFAYGAATIHILPEGDVLATLRRAYLAAKGGSFPDFPAIEWYVHTSVDPSLRDENGHHSSAFFVQWVPNRAPTDDERTRYVADLVEKCELFAPGLANLVEEAFALFPIDIERHFGMSGGHIHHIDNSFAFTDRMPYATGIPGLYAAGAGCHPAGSVIGAAGHNAARRLLADLRPNRCAKIKGH